MTTSPRPGNGIGRVAVIVASIDAGATVRASLAWFAEEVDGRGEVVLVDASRDATAEEIARGVPGVRVIRRPSGALAPELWRVGLDATDAPLVAFSTAAMVPTHGWLDAMLARLDATGAAAVGGPIEPAERLAPTDRAVYLLRYVNYLLPLPAAAVAEPPGDNAVYRRDRLRGLEPVIDSGFWEVEVHRRLRDRGERLAMADGAAVTFHGGSRLGPTLRQRFRHARHYGAARGSRQTTPARLARAAAAPLVPTVLMWRAAATLRARGRPCRPWFSALPGLAILLAAWALGEAYGTLTGPGPAGATAGLRGRNGFGIRRTRAGEG
jgi:hypothetical protein